MERYRHGVGVVTSLARSLRGGPIKNARLVAFDGDRVTLLYRARHEEGSGGRAVTQRLTLSSADSLQRVLLPCAGPPDTGSPVLAHGSLHDALALWLETVVQPHGRGEALLCR
jgi:hypothetical protein